MKYLEELLAGDVFSYKNELYLLSIDHKKDKDKRKHSMSISLMTGAIRWIADNAMVEVIQLYQLDNNNNFAPIKS